MQNIITDNADLIDLVQGNHAETRAAVETLKMDLENVQLIVNQNDQAMKNVIDSNDANFKAQTEQAMVKLGGEMGIMRAQVEEQFELYKHEVKLEFGNVNDKQKAIEVQLEELKKYVDGVIRSPTLSSGSMGNAETEFRSRITSLEIAIERVKSDSGKAFVEMSKVIARNKAHASAFIFPSKN